MYSNKSHINTCNIRSSINWNLVAGDVCSSYKKVKSGQILQARMKLLQYPQIVFRIFGILPLDGVDFNTYRCFEILRMCLFPVPNFVTCVTMFAFFLIHTLDIGKSTDALFAGIGFLNAVLIYSMLMYNKRELLALMNNLQALLDQSKSKPIDFVWFLQSWDSSIHF